MATTTPPSISALPPAPDPNDRSSFNTRAYPWSAALPAFGSQASALADNVKANADEAARQATLATAHANLASTSASIATGAANYQGDYAAGTTYQIGQSCSFGSIVYLAKTVNLGVTPVEGANWMTLSIVTLTGNLSLYVTQVSTLTITNYDSATAYTVSATGGTVSRTGDQITYTAGATAGSHALTVNGRNVPITVLPATVLAPVITSPTNGETGASETPTFTTGAFTTVGGADTHLDTSYELHTGPDRTGTLVWSSLNDAANKTSITLPAGLVPVSSTRYLSVSHRGTTLGASAWTTHSYTTEATYTRYIATPAATPANFGDPFEGGFYAGLIWNQLVQSSSSKTLATGTQTFTVPDMTFAPLVYAGQTLEVRSRADPANKFVGTVAEAAGTTLTLDVSSIGGGGTFSDWSVMARYRSIVAPKSSGEHVGMILKNTDSALPTACQTLAEGWLATEAMKNAGDSTVYPAAHWARSLVIGGRSDWYIPARDECELHYRNLKPTTVDNITTASRINWQSVNYANNGSVGDTAVTHGTNNNTSPPGSPYTASVPAQTAATAFWTGGAETFVSASEQLGYWTSSEVNATFAWIQYWGSDGLVYQHVDGKSTNTHRVRACRRSII